MFDIWHSRITRRLGGYHLVAYHITDAANSLNVPKCSTKETVSLYYYRELVASIYV